MKKNSIKLKNLAFARFFNLINNLPIVPRMEVLEIECE